ncbi:MAG TPA: sulfite exporter TauE/SafE family protein, partial [Ktedonobacteraceae bacterium]|nr:sulfite exporter TauE/SafE family protein [Ktedonobacteraceae bacterium]
MNIINMIVLFVAAMLGGALNSVAGGGSFISFPALIFTGVPAISANATNTVALWPGSVASTWAYRKELATVDRMVLLVFSVVSLIGGILGAVLLLRTSQAIFVRLIPYLLLVATLLFAFSGRITAFIRKRLGRKSQMMQEDELAVAKKEAGVADRAEEMKEEVQMGDSVEMGNRAEAELPAPTNHMMVRPGKAALAGIAVLQLVISTYGGYFGGG